MDSENFFNIFKFKKLNQNGLKKNQNGSFSAVSTRIFASKHSFCSIFFRSTIFAHFCTAPNSKNSQTLIMFSLKVWHFLVNICQHWQKMSNVGQHLAKYWPMFPQISLEVDSLLTCWYRKCWIIFIFHHISYLLRQKSYFLTWLKILCYHSYVVLHILVYINI